MLVEYSARNGILNYATDTTWFESISKQDFNPQRGELAMVDLASVDKIFIPVNVNKVHWILIVVDRTQQTTTLYDSLAVKEEEYNKGKEILKVYLLSIVKQI